MSDPRIDAIMGLQKTDPFKTNEIRTSHVVDPYKSNNIRTSQFADTSKPMKYAHRNSELPYIVDPRKCDVPLARVLITAHFRGSTI